MHATPSFPAVKYLMCMPPASWVRVQSAAGSDHGSLAGRLHCYCYWTVVILADIYAYYVPSTLVGTFYWYYQGFPGGASGKEPGCKRKTHKRHKFSALVREDPLEEAMATHSSILGWRIPWAEEPGGLQSLGLKESNRLKYLSMHACINIIK